VNGSSLTGAGGTAGVDVCRNNAAPGILQALHASGLQQQHVHMLGGCQALNAFSVPAVKGHPHQCMAELSHQCCAGRLGARALKGN
jgi:hypothetical protein